VFSNLTFYQRGADGSYFMPRGAIPFYTVYWTLLSGDGGKWDKNIYLNNCGAVLFRGGFDYFFALKFIQASIWFNDIRIFEIKLQVNILILEKMWYDWNTVFDLLLK
ncbi:hypothetical protein, partial [Alicyclobacillus suci]|uniref:hypothetical protein n=1 Tax=Alicyclobacillus suci TaxID=2816080 RepID=UPI001A8E2AF9